MKTISVRLDGDQEDKLRQLSEELHNSEAGVCRYAIDLLWKTLTSDRSPASEEQTAVKAD